MMIFFVAESVRTSKLPTKRKTRSPARLPQEPGRSVASSREEETRARSLHHSSGAEAPAQADLRVLRARPILMRLTLLT